jgi:hypothetical protein
LHNSELIHISGLSFVLEVGIAIISFPILLVNAQHSA